MCMVHGMGIYWKLYSQTKKKKKIILGKFNRKILPRTNVCEYMFCKFLTVNKRSLNTCSVKYWIEQMFANIRSRLENFSINVNEWKNVYLCTLMNDYAL